MTAVPLSGAALTVGCPLPLAPLCDVAGSASSSVAGGVLSTIAGWVAAGAHYLLGQVGGALSATTTVDVAAPWFGSHYTVMAAIAALVAVPMLAVAAVQAVFRQSPGLLARSALVQVPLAGLLSLVALQLVQLSLGATDALSSVVAKSAGTGISRALQEVAAALVSEATAPIPTFVLVLGGLLVAAGALVLWLELIVRAAAVYVAVLFLPLALASLVWPSVSHWCRRLVETLAAIVLSKFVIVAVLSLAVGALGSGTGFAAVLAGGALLLLAAFTPFTLLRLVPLMEAGAALHLEGARHRLVHAATSMPTTAAAFALRRAHAAGTRTPGEAGTGAVTEPEPAGAAGAVAGVTASPTPGHGAPAGAGAPVRLPSPRWRGVPSSEQAFEAALRDPPKVLRDKLGYEHQDGIGMPLWGGNLPGRRDQRGVRDLPYDPAVPDVGLLDGPLDAWEEP